MHDNKSKTAQITHAKLLIAFIIVSAVWFLLYRLIIVQDPELPDWEPMDRIELDQLKTPVPHLLEYLFVHCTANRAGSNITKKNGKAYLWRVAQERHFPGYGYNWIIYEDGQIDTLIPVNKDMWVTPNERASGAKGYNSISFHVAYMGGLNRLGYPANTLTPAAKQSLNLIASRVKALRLSLQVCPHYKVSVIPKACPSFKFECY